MNDNTTFSAKAAREELKNQMSDMSYDLCDYGGCICDAISEFADSWTREKIAAPAQSGSGHFST